MWNLIICAEEDNNVSGLETSCTCTDRFLLALQRGVEDEGHKN